MPDLELSRAEKDEYFQNGDHSPIPEELRGGFTGLVYFPIDDSYTVEAEFVPSESTEVIKLHTTKNDLRDVVRAGTLTFTLNQTECSLTAFRFVGSDDQSFFLPFTDATTGDETYGTGRYIDLEINEDATDYVIDFNEAYNPYCAYNPNYSCPLVPEENRLPVAVRAGEKAWEAH